MTFPSSWTEATLPDLIGHAGVMTDGDWVETEDQDPSGEIRLIQLADVGDGAFRDRSNRFLTELKSRELRCTILVPGDLLIARMPDPLGRACVFPGLAQKCCTVVDVCIVRSGCDQVFARWLMHFVNSPRFRAAIAGLQSGSTRKRISKKNLSSLKLPVPPAKEQQRIVDAVDSCSSRLDAAADGLRRVEANLKRYRASVLRAAVEGRLVQTEAELAKEETRLYEPASVLVDSILRDRRRRWEEAELAKMRARNAPPKDDKWRTKYEEPEGPSDTLPTLPAGWCWTTVGQLADVGTGATPNRAQARYWDNGSIPWVSSGAVSAGRISAPTEHVTEAALRETNLTLFPPGTVVVAMYGEGKTRGKAAVLEIAATTNQALAAVQLGSIAESVRAWLLLCLEHNYEDTRRLSSGGVQPNLNLSLVRSIAIPLPPLVEQRRACAEADRCISQDQELQSSTASSLQRLVRLRQSILTWAFKGKLVDQDPNDESASMLLARIKADREKEATHAPSSGSRRAVRSKPKRPVAVT